MTTQMIIDNISVAYGHQQVIQDCSFSLSSGTILSLLGASGCGKSTLLKAIAGLLPLSNGRILLGEEVIAEPARQPDYAQRQIGMIFQDYALFPHLSVAENVKFGLHQLNRDEQQQRCDQALQTIKLSNLAERYPHELSGGQQQRVAIARTLVCRPKLILFDEPFSNIDVNNREALMDEIKTLLKSQNITAIFVTHDKTEAFAMADEIAILEQGKIAQIDRPQQLYDHPHNHHIADFLGSGTLLPATQVANQWQTPIGKINAQQPQILTLQPNKSQTMLFLRPHQINIEADEQGLAIVQASHFKGDLQSYLLALPECQISITTQQRFSIGQKLKLSLNLTDYAS